MTDAKQNTTQALTLFLQTTKNQWETQQGRRTEGGGRGLNRSQHSMLHLICGAQDGAQVL